MKTIDIEENDVVIHDAEIFFTNFSGRKETYNEEGHCYFRMVFDGIEDKDAIDKLKELGLKMIPLKKKDSEDREYYSLCVTVRPFLLPKGKGYFVPIALIGNTLLFDDKLSILDRATKETLTNVNVRIHLYDFYVREQKFIRVLLKQIWTDKELIIG